MSLSREPRQEWHSWDQLMQKEPQVKRSSSEALLERSDPMASLDSRTIER